MADFLLEKDQIFVPVVLSSNEPGNEQTLFWQTKYKIMPEIPVPDLVIYLETSDDVINKRLQKRTEQNWRLFPDGYINQIHEGYRRFFHVYDHSPVLTVKADTFDFANNPEHFEMLLDAIKNQQGNRLFLNLGFQENE